MSEEILEGKNWEWSHQLMLRASSFLWAQRSGDVCFIFFFEGLSGVSGIEPVTAECKAGAFLLYISLAGIKIERKKSE